MRCIGTNPAEAIFARNTRRLKARRNGMTRHFRTSPRGSSQVLAVSLPCTRNLSRSSTFIPASGVTSDAADDAHLAAEERRLARADGSLRIQTCQSGHVDARSAGRAE